MPRHSLRPCSERFNDLAAVATYSLLEFLSPAFAHQRRLCRHSQRPNRIHSLCESRAQHDLYEGFFLGAVAQASKCHDHAMQSHPPRAGLYDRTPTLRSGLIRSGRRLSYEASSKRRPRQQIRYLSTEKTHVSARAGHEATSEDTFRAIFDSKARGIASESRLPKDFFDDVFQIQVKVRDLVPGPDQSHPSSYDGFTKHGRSETDDEYTEQPTEDDLQAQMKLLRSVRELEEKLAKARAALRKSVSRLRPASGNELLPQPSDDTGSGRHPIKLTKNDYIGLVDLYYYSRKNRWSPIGPDYSPSVSFISNYNVDASEVFETPETARKEQHLDERAGPQLQSHGEEDPYESPLKDIEKTLLRNQRREVRIMQDFVDLLLDDQSSNRDLFYAYQRFPHPGVAWLPKGVQRLFLQRMSTPWTKSRRSMLRYLSIIDDMQYASLPITAAEWSSAIYLAGRSVSVVTMAEVDAAIVMWRKMERDAGVRATDTTFNILFDIAVRAGKYALAEGFLKELYARDLRLNRLGRVSLIYYHGLRGDGDAVRRTYRDFIEAGEIVDTLVLNCVIASLLNAQEPSAAEQVFERMRDLQKRLKRGKRADGSDTFYMRYPGPPETLGSTYEREMGPNALGRILAKAPHLKETLPDHHADLQDMMPLRPDHVTFRAMISYHANVSADLDRITVLLQQMTEEYNLPLRPVFYLLLFKGFALHGKPKNEHSRWSFQRLELAWDACRKAIIEARAARRAAYEAATHVDNEEPSLPKVSELDSILSQEVKEEALPKEKRPDAWNDFVLELASPPGQRRKPIERIHAQLFDDETAPTRFLNPFFPSKKTDPIAAKDSFYALGHHSHIDHEEGEYVLPSPSRTITHQNLAQEEVHPGHEETVTPQENPYTDGESEVESPGVTRTHEAETEQHDDDSVEDAAESESDGSAKTDMHGRHDPPDDYAQYVASQNLVANRQMVCWLLRAYTQCTGSRAKVEEIWGSVRKVYRPLDDAEKRSVVRVLQRCLRHCDSYGDYML